MALAKRQRFVTLPYFTLALIAALAIGPTAVRADVVGFGDITPSQPDPFPEQPGDQIPNLPQFGGPVTGGVLIVGGTGQLVGGTSAGQMTIDIPSDTAPLTSREDARVLMSVNGLAVLALGILPQPLMALCIYSIRASLQ